MDEIYIWPQFKALLWRDWDLVIAHFQPPEHRVAAAKQWLEHAVGYVDERPFVKALEAMVDELPKPERQLVWIVISSAEQSLQGVIDTIPQKAPKPKPAALNALAARYL